MFILLWCLKPTVPEGGPRALLRNLDGQPKSTSITGNLALIWDYRSDVRSLDWTFEILAPLSKSGPDVRKDEKWKSPSGVQKRASRISRWSKTDLLKMNIHIPGSNISNITKKLPKINKIFFKIFQTNSKFPKITYQTPDHWHSESCVTRLSVSGGPMRGVERGRRPH